MLVPPLIRIFSTSAGLDPFLPVLQRVVHHSVSPDSGVEFGLNRTYVNKRCLKASCLTMDSPVFFLVDHGGGGGGAQEELIRRVI